MGIFEDIVKALAEAGTNVTRTKGSARTPKNRERIFTNKKGEMFAATPDKIERVKKSKN